MTETVTVNTTPKEPTLEETAKAMGIDTAAVDDTATSQAAPERPAWLPEKFKTVEDFANSYAELEKKLGAGKPSEDGEKPKESGTEEEAKEATPKQPETPKEEATVEEAKEAVENAGLDFDELSAKYWEKGALEDSDYEALEKAGIPRHIADQFAAGQQALIHIERQEAFSVVGGEENYTSMVQWAAENFSDKEIETYDKAVNGNDKAARMMAIEGLKARFEAKVGFEPKRTAGANGSRPTLDTYESVAQLQADMRDPRYGKDPAFIAKVEAKLARSDIF
jgi:hypothetical protein